MRQTHHKTKGTYYYSLILTKVPEGNTGSKQIRRQLLKLKRWNKIGAR